jgi:hypothetical protein
MQRLFQEAQSLSICITVLISSLYHPATSFNDEKQDMSSKGSVFESGISPAYSWLWSLGGLLPEPIEIEKIVK